MEKDRLLGLMRFWLIGTFLIVCVTTTLYMALLFQHDLLSAMKTSLPVWGITGVLCIAWYYVYKLYLRRRD